MTVLEDSSGNLIRTACTALVYLLKVSTRGLLRPRAQELCESRGGSPGLPSPINLRFSVDVKQHFNQPTSPSEPPLCPFPFTSTTVARTLSGEVGGVGAGVGTVEVIGQLP